jgi:hypothetical protein
VGWKQKQWKSLEGPILITEKRFILSHSSFWAMLLPMENEWIRFMNARARSYTLAIEDDANLAVRGIVNELGCLLYAECIATGVDVDELEMPTVEESLNKAWLHVRDMRAYMRQIEMPRLSESAITESRLVCKNIQLFFESWTSSSPTAYSVFPGCGWLSACTSDFIVDGTLIEVKAGGRKFRSIDLRQLLVYGALNFAAKQIDISSICLLNPRRGVFAHTDLEVAATALSGRNASELFNEIVHYISEPFDKSENSVL